MSNPSRTRPLPTGWVGWVGFAGLMMLINGVLNAISGIAAIAEDQVYLGGSSTVVALDLTTFGWIHVALGIVVALAGFFVLRGAVWAVAVAVLVTSLNLVSQMLNLPSYPFWSLLIIGIDVLILWGLVVHSEEMVVV